MDDQHPTVGPQALKMNPLNSDRPFKLGTFSTNLRGGLTMSTADGILGADWNSVLELARLADEMEFEAIVPVGRWKGFGGKTDFNGAGFESFTFAAGVGARTSHPAVFATSHISTIHPLMAAKQAATIDHITNGRFVINVVTGWYEPEMSMFGIDMLPHDQRYEMAAEWISIVRSLWTSEHDVNFDGKYYRLKNASIKPLPIQKPMPPVMCAGGSPAGKRFAAEFADISFLNFHSFDDEEKVRSEIESLRRLAKEEFGREIQIWTHGYIYQGTTQLEAEKYYNHIVHEMGDWDAAESVMRFIGIHSETYPPEKLRGMKERWVAGFGGLPIIGTADTVVENIAKLKRVGFDGALFAWPRYLEDLRVFKNTTMPRLVEAGLR